MRRLLIAAVILGVLAAVFFWYRHRHSENGLQVDPQVRKEIEKAKRQ